MGQIRAGRRLLASDFTAILGRSTPPALFGLSSLANGGSGAPLVNKGGVPFGTGILGAASEAAVFAGSTAQALYITDTGAADPLRIRNGSWGCWQMTSKRGVQQVVMSKIGTTTSYRIDVGAGANVAQVIVSPDGSATGSLVGTIDVCDGRWHHIVATFDTPTLRLYVDGVPDGSVTQLGLLFGSSGPFNIGGQQGDASTATVAPHYGRIDEAFVTPDVLDLDEIRFLMCASLSHGLPRLPHRTRVAVRRAKRGGSLVTGDFPTTPSRLYNLIGADSASKWADAGANGAAVTGVGVGVLLNGVVPGPDGRASGAQNLGGGDQLQATDTGLPSGLAARSYGLWTKVAASITGGTFMAWGTISTGDARLDLFGGNLRTLSNGDTINLPQAVVADGRWHHIVVVEDNAAADGVRRKLYIDGRLVGTSTVLSAIVLGGANSFRIGAASNGQDALTGALARVFVHPGALTGDQVRTLYAKSSLSLPPSEIPSGHVVEAMDATNVYLLGNDLEPQHSIDLRVAS